MVSEASEPVQLVKQLEKTVVKAAIRRHEAVEGLRLCESSIDESDQMYKAWLEGWQSVIADANQMLDDAVNNLVGTRKRLGWN